MTIHELINYIPKLLAYLICIVSLVQLFIVFFINRKDIIKDLRGKDLTWQFLELTGIVWLVMFPCVVVTSLLGLEVSAGTWASMDAIYFINIGGKMGHKWLDNKNNSNNNTTKTNKDETL